MAKSSTLTVRIVSDAKDAARGFADAESRVDRFSRGLDKASIAAGGVLGGLALVGQQAFQAASDLQQSTGAINAVFGDWALDIEQHAQAAAQSVGLPTSAYEQMAATIGASLKNFGLSNGEAMDQTTGLITTAADLAATFGGTTQQAVEALGSALRGETDPIERYGIGIKAADVAARMAADGTSKLTGEAGKQAQAHAVLALITEQSAAAQGSFAREADTAAGAQQRASAEFENAKAALGEALLPIVADAATKFSGLTGTLTEHKDTVMIVGAVLAGLAVAVIAVNAAVKAYRAATVVVTAVQWLWNAAIAANPIVLIALGIAALIAGVILAYQKLDWFKNIVDRVGSALAAAFNGAKAAVSWVVDKIQWLLDKAGGAVSWIGDLFSAPGGGPAGGGMTYGAAAGAAPVRAAAFGSGGGAGGLSSAGGGGQAFGTVVNITVTGAVDPVSTARQIRKLLGDLDVVTGAAAPVDLARGWA